MEDDLVCKRCRVVVLKRGKGTLFSQPSELRCDDREGTETLGEWIAVKDMFTFENIAFSRDFKNLPGGERLLTCAGCEKGILGKALPHGEGPDIKMESMVAISRFK